MDTIFEASNTVYEANIEGLQASDDELFVEKQKIVQVVGLGGGPPARNAANGEAGATSALVHGGAAPTVTTVTTAACRMSSSFA